MSREDVWSCECIASILFNVKGPGEPSKQSSNGKLNCRVSVRVELCGLKSKPELNGQCGVVTALIPTENVHVVIFITVVG